MKTPDYIEPMLLAAKPYTLSGNRDSAATVAWEVANALDAAGYVIVPKEPTEAMDTAPMQAKLGVGSFTAREAWRVMISAAQTQETRQSED